MVEGKGVLYCCGRRLSWERAECGCCMEVVCGQCDTLYVMALADEDGEPDEIRLEDVVVAEKIKELSLRDGGLFQGPGILSFAA